MIVVDPWLPINNIWCGYSVCCAVCPVLTIFYSANLRFFSRLKVDAGVPWSIFSWSSVSRGSDGPPFAILIQMHAHVWSVRSLRKYSRELTVPWISFWLFCWILLVCLWPQNRYDFSLMMPRCLVEPSFPSAFVVRTGPGSAKPIRPSLKLILWPALALRMLSLD